MRTESAGISRILLVRMDSGEDVLASLRGAVEENGLRNGLVLSGVGSLVSYHIHVVKSTAVPPGDTFLWGEGPFDIVNLNGLVMEGRVHAHITFADSQKTLGGHLEEGCRILTFGVAMLAETPDALLTGWDRIGQMEAIASNGGTTDERAEDTVVR